MKLNDLLTDYFCQFNNIDINSDYIIERIDAKSLFVPERIDLITKLKYIEYKEKGYDLTFVKELYKAQIDAFSYGSYCEPGDKNKKTIESYFHVFDELIESIKQNGFDENISVVPLGKNNTILNGSHRVAIAAYYNISVPVIRFNHLSLNYNYVYFKKRQHDEIYLDYLVTEHCKLMPNVYFACLWPRASGKKNSIKVNKIINDNCKVIYQKNVKLNLEGLFHLMVQIYSLKPFIGDESNNYNGARTKAFDCFEYNNYLKVYVFECASLDNVVNMKETIRKELGIGNSSFHTTYNNEESIRLANLLLNNNSINFLNQAKPLTYFGVNEMIKEYKNKILENSLPIDHFIMVSDGIMSLYGLKEVKEIEYMSITMKDKMIEGNEIHNSGDYISCYSKELDKLIFDPRNHFYYNDIKIITLNKLIQFKQNRNNTVDKMDIQAINKINDKQNEIRLKLKTWRKVKLRKIRYFFIRCSLKLLHKLHLFDAVRKLYLFLSKPFYKQT